MVFLKVESGTSYAAKDVFCEIAPNVKFTKFHCYYDIMKLDSDIYFCGTLNDTKREIQISLPLTAGYGGTGPHDLIDCIRAAGFSEEEIPSNSILEQPEDRIVRIDFIR